MGESQALLDLIRARSMLISHFQVERHRTRFPGDLDGKQDLGLRFGDPLVPRAFGSWDSGLQVGRDGNGPIHQPPLDVESDVADAGHRRLSGGGCHPPRHLELELETAWARGCRGRQSQEAAPLVLAPRVPDPEPPRRPPPRGIAALAELLAGPGSAVRHATSANDTQRSLSNTALRRRCPRESRPAMV